MEKAAAGGGGAALRTLSVGPLPGGPHEQHAACPPATQKKEIRRNIRLLLLILVIYKWKLH